MTDDRSLVTTLGVGVQDSNDKNGQKIPSVSRSLDRHCGIFVCLRGICYHGSTFVLKHIFFSTGATLEMALTIGMIKTSGIFFVNFQQRFDSTSSITSLLSTVQNGVYSVGGK